MTSKSLNTSAQNAVLNMIDLKLPWNLTDLEAVKKNGRKVFSIFSCGGGSTMGYKLAGFEVIGCCEIDKAMFTIYRMNHAPKHGYNLPVQEFNKQLHESIPEHLLDLDILDGSPPCSSFSMSGSREKDWGENKKFREGQAEQVLDDLFFHFIETAKLLQPKVVVAENVKGLIAGNARYYVKQIFQAFADAGYETQLFLMNAASMGVPQRRERVFFVARRKDLGLGKIEMNFDFPTMTIGQAFADLKDQKGRMLTEGTTKLWERVKPGQALSKAHPKGHRFNAIKVDPSKPCPTVTASGDGTPMHWNEPRRFSRLEVIRAQSFPDDYDFFRNEPGYVCGMSVPPFMMARIADRIAETWFKN